MLQKLNVLHLEDEEMVADLIRAILAGQATIVWVKTIATAKTEFAARGGEYDVVIVDGRLGAETSFSFASEIRARFDRPKPVIIGITGEDREFRAKMVWAGCDWVLEKPFRAAELIDIFTQAREALAAAKPTS